MASPDEDRGSGDVTQLSSADQELLLGLQHEGAAGHGTSSGEGWAEDKSQVTKKERWGWYLYEAAQQVYPTSVLLSFLPP